MRLSLSLSLEAAKAAIDIFEDVTTKVKEGQTKLDNKWLVRPLKMKIIMHCILLLHYYYSII